MIKKIVLIIYVLMILASVSCSREYTIKKIDIDKIDYAKSCKIYNDIRYLDGYLYIYTTKDISKEHYSGGEGILNSIIQIDRKYDFIQERMIKNNIGFNYDYKYYYIDKNGNIIYHKLFEKLNRPLSSIVDVYDRNEAFVKSIDVKKNISYMDFFLDLDNDTLYYSGFEFAKGGNPSYAHFCIFQKGKNKTVNRAGTDLVGYFVNNDANNLYMLSGGSFKLYIFNKERFNNSDKPKADTIINMASFLYRKTNLEIYNNEKNGAVVKNNIFYQIRFYSPSEKETINDRSFVDQTSKSVQTLLIGVDLEKEELVKEIKINYNERYIYQSPNTFTVDDKGNIYILDSKNKNIITINHKAKKIEINYKY